MRCARCPQDNPPGARFCTACGAPLAESCPACGAALPEGARFCPGCGRALAGAAAAAPPATAARAPEGYTPRHLAEKILTSRTALQGERKPVTVLFCDLVGSTTLAERLGPDAMHDLLNRFFETALAEVHRYEGTINQFLGDGFMALFGAPIAHEDHARRAVLAALGVARAAGERPVVLDSGEQVALSLRMGLNTGFVVVGAIGDNLRMDYTAVGDTTHLAARLQQLAPPGTILVSDATARLVAGFAALEPHGALEVRGLAGPVVAHRLTGLAAHRPALDVERRALTAFVGRDGELAALASLLERACAGRGHAVGVVGEPGVGKSRLLLELRRAAAGRDATWLAARCLSYGAGIPYLPVLELLRAACGIADADPPERVADKLCAALAAAGLDPAERAPWLLRLLGVKDRDDSGEPAAGEDGMARTFDALRQLFVRLGRQRPLVLLVEDLQWIDGTSEAFLASLVEALAAEPILLVTTCRPGYQPPWGGRSWATRLALAPLAADSSLAVARAVLPDLDPRDPRARLILDKAEGNPFFLEELARVVADAPGAGFAVPDSVHGVLTARIDRLPDRPKRLLQTASVLGREFPVRLLAALADEPEHLEADLIDLTRREFLFRRTDADEPACVFKHALTQDVAHATLLAGPRRALHRRAAAALEALYPERLRDLAPVLAHHYLEAEAWGEAAEHAARAAEAAWRSYAGREALARYDQAVLAADRAKLPGARRASLLEARARVHTVLGEFEPALRDLEGASALAEAAGDTVAQGRILTALGALRGGHQDYHEGLELTRRAAALVERTGDVHALAEARAQVGVMLLNLVRMAESRRELEAARDLFAAAGDEAGHARILEMLAMNRWLAGDVEGALATLEEAIPRLRAVGDRATECTALVCRGAGRAWRDRLEAGWPDFERALDTALALEARNAQAFVRALVADFCFMYARYDVALREARAALEIAREIGHLEWTAYALSGLGRVHLACGDPGTARALLDEELAVARRQGSAIWIADALANRGELLLHEGCLEEAGEALREAVDVAGECAEKIVYPLLHLGDLALRRDRPDEALDAVARFRARAAQYTVPGLDARRIEAQALDRTGRTSDAEAVLREVAADAGGRGAASIAWRALLALADLLDRTGRGAEAREAAGRALVLLDRVAAALPDDLRRAFAGTGPVRRAARYHPRS